MGLPRALPPLKSQPPATLRILNDEPEPWTTTEAVRRYASWDAQTLPEDLVKYHAQRRRLFWTWDDDAPGAERPWVDREGLFSVTPQAVAQHTAERVAAQTDAVSATGETMVVVDAFAGVGGNAIQFARLCGPVIAIDTSAERLFLARHNARLAGLDGYILFVHGNFFDAIPWLRREFAIRAVFLSPPWGGPLSVNDGPFDLERDIQLVGRGGETVDGVELFELVSNTVCAETVYFLPRNVTEESIQRCRLSVAAHARPLLEAEECCYRVGRGRSVSRVRVVSVYAGRLAQRD